MNKIVREHYPVELLPEDLQRLVPGVQSVTIEITEESSSEPKPLSKEEAVVLMRQMQEENSRSGRSVSWEEAVKRVRELRDEWED